MNAFDVIQSKFIRAKLCKQSAVICTHKQKLIMVCDRNNQLKLFECESIITFCSVYK